MNYLEAVERIDYHAGNQEAGLDTPSFVAMLRPYNGLREEAYTDVLRCLRAVSKHIREAHALDKSLIASLWAIAWYPRYWALEMGSMLRRNDLISADDQATLSGWVNQIAHTVSLLLEGAEEEEAFASP